MQLANIPFQDGVIVPRWYQQEAVNSIFQYFEQNRGNPIIAMPTGTGKSVVIAIFLKMIFQYWANQRILVLTHVKELIEQNAKKILQAWPYAPLGIYSAGLKSRDFIQPIIAGGAQSVVHNIEAFGWRDLVIIDECHLVNPDATTRYMKILDGLRKINPHLKVIGLSATWYRLGLGLLTNGGMFTDIAYNICDTVGFNRLISEGYLCPPIPKVTKTALDVSNVGMSSNGDFNAAQMQKAVDRTDLNTACMAELVEHGIRENRNSWLVFCSGIEHSEHCAQILQQMGIRAAAMHSGLAAGKRDAILKAHKSGELQAVTNNNMLTTGYDDERIDLIGCVRPTMSPGLWVQMIGRGTRPSPDNGKVNCRVLDFARNCQRLGPIDDPVIPKQKGPGGGEAPVKICDYCGAYNHARVRFCIDCGQEFTFEQKIVRQADTRQILSTGLPEVKRFEVSRVMYNRHIARTTGSINIKVTYLCGLQMFQEFVNFDATGYALHRAHEWWRQRHPGEPPLSTDLALHQLANLRTPKAIKVWVNRKHPEILSHEY